MHKKVRIHLLKITLLTVLLFEIYNKGSYRREKERVTFVRIMGKSCSFFIIITEIYKLYGGSKNEYKH